MRTHYDVLGVDPGADAGEVRRAWIALARHHHPDRGGDPARMREVNEAWSVLGNAPARRNYDRSLGALAEPPPDPGPGRFDDTADHRFEHRFDDDEDDGTTFVAHPVRAPAPGLALVPPGLFVASIFLACFALVLDEPAVLGVAGSVFFLSCVSVAALALLSLRSPRRARPRR